MGLGICLVAPLPKSIIRTMPWATFKKLVTETLKGDYTHVHEDDESFALDVHPCAESLRFEPAKGGKFVAETKTSTLGPGFHAHIVDLLKRVAAAANIRVDWAEADETGYAVDGDFAALQEQMADQFHAIVNILTQRAGDDGLYIHWPIGTPTPRGNPGGLFAPVGPLSAAWCRDFLAGNDADAKCREFYVWWNRERDADYWRKLVNPILWSEVRWRPPMNEQEARTWSLALAAADKLEELGAAHLLPAAELAELRELMDWNEETPCREPSPKGIGYYRHGVQWQLPGGWSMVLGGYFFEDVEEDEEGTQTRVWYFNDRTVRFSSARVGDASEPAPAAELLDAARERAPKGSEVVELEHGQARSTGFFGTDTSEETGAEYNILLSTLALDGHIAWITFAFTDPAHREWALEVLQSVTPSSVGEAGND